MEGTFVHPLFGNVRFRTAHDVWLRGDDITFVSGFDTHDVTSLHIPQLEQVPGAHGGNIRFHKRGHAQLKMAFEDIERPGLLKHINRCGGTFNPRLRKPTDGSTSKLPSNHAFGTAIDLNSEDPGASTISSWTHLAKGLASRSGNALASRRIASIYLVLRGPRNRR